MSIASSKNSHDSEFSELKDSTENLLEYIKNGEDIKQHIDSVNPALAESVLTSQFKLHETGLETGRIIRTISNVYPLTKNRFSLDISYVNKSTGKLKSLFNLVAIKANNNQLVKFDIPLFEETKHWRKTTIGNVVYHYRSDLNTERAERFSEKHARISSNFGLKPEKLNFYMVENYQEFLALVGVKFDSKFSGKYRDGYGVNAGVIFSVMANEDFSHDIVHYYARKVNEVRNWYAEEGLAYLWGNAYYTDQSQEIPEISELVRQLQKVVSTEEDLLDWFRTNPKIFKGTNLPPEVSVRSVMSALICNQVIIESGLDGLFELISSSKGLEPFFRATEKLIKLTPDNFNSEMREMISEYKPSKIRN